jgi:8-amino-7-oxononanoate synthase
VTQHRRWLAERAAEREAAGLVRVVHPRPQGADLLDLAGNDYLGLARDPRVIGAAVEATRDWGTGATGSRLVTGTTQIHNDLEVELAQFAGAEAALVFSSGYAANLALIATFGGNDALIVSADGNHASIIDGCRLSRSRVVVTPRGDVGAVATALRARIEARALVVTDTVFSSDGALAPIGELKAMCHRYDALLVADEAHAFGVLGSGGRGLAEVAGIATDRDLARTVTLSKSLGSQGGAVLGSAAVVEDLRNSARTFIFDTGLAPSSVGAARRALQILRDEPSLAARVRSRADLLASALGVAPPMAAVVSVVLGDPRLATAVSDRCRSEGVLVGCFRPPSVPAGTSRIRLTARADLTEPQVLFGAEVVLDAMKRLS